jgi:hypothetical protein
MNLTIRYYVAIILLLISGIYYYYFNYGFGTKTIVISAQGCTCPYWKTETGSRKLRNSIKGNGYGLDSVVDYEFNSAGLTIDSLREFGDYDPYIIRYQFDKIEIDINGEKKYCPVLKILNWQHIDLITWLGSNLFLAIMALVWLVILASRLRKIIKERIDK